MMNMARCMLKEKHLSLTFWGEAMSTTAYILNKCPTKKLKYRVLEEVWTQRKPPVKHLRVFGSLCFKNVPDERRKRNLPCCQPPCVIDQVFQYLRWKVRYLVLSLYK